MLLPGTEMHIVTFVFTLLECAMFCVQLALYLIRPADRHRRYFLVLIDLLIVYNITGGLFPDLAIPIPVHIQNIIAYGTGFLTAAYFPYYFYRVFNLRLLRFHALYGVPLFLLLPFLLFFVISYAWHKDLWLAIRYGVVVPFYYSLVLLWAILRAIRVAYRENRNKKRYMEEILMYLAVAPWSAMTLIAYFDLGQLTEALFTNLGFLVITALFISRSVTLSRAEQRQLDNLRQLTMDTEVIRMNCAREMLTPRETEIAVLLCHRLKRREIADKLFISGRTVDKHSENIFVKVGVTSREELLAKLNTPS